jgi:hypothetical protein
MNRRRLLVNGLSFALGSLLNQKHSVGQTADSVKERQKGDPSLASQTLTYAPQQLSELMAAGKAIGVKKDATQLALKILEIARKESETIPTPEIGTVKEYFDLFGVPVKDEDGNVQPFCAAGLSHAACQAYCDLHPDEIAYTKYSRLTEFKGVLPDLNKFYFLPHCSTIKMVDDARARGKWIPKSANVSALNPGWLVFYDWDSTGQPQHVGIIEDPKPDWLHTVEYNTTFDGAQSDGKAGHIVRKMRKYNLVLGYVSVY